jgi:hypothetical protein
MYADQPQLLTQPVEMIQPSQDPERARRMRGVLTQMSLRDEKVLFRETRAGRVLGSDPGREPSPRDPMPECSSRIH